MQYKREEVRDMNLYGEILKKLLEHVLEEPSDNTKEKLMEIIKDKK